MSFSVMRSASYWQCVTGRDPKGSAPLDRPTTACYPTPVKYEPLLHVVLHQPEIPYNTGSVGRTCVAAGAKLWLVRPLGFRVDDYYLRRAGLDYWEHLEWEVVDDWIALCDRLPPPRHYYFSKTATRAYTDVKFEQSDVLVFGNESQGLPRSMLDADPQRALRIPIRAAARSLNLSNSVAIVVFEARRQWEAYDGAATPQPTT